MGWVGWVRFWGLGSDFGSWDKFWVFGFFNEFWIGFGGKG